MPRKAKTPAKPPAPEPTKATSLHKEVKLLAMAAGGILLLVAVFIPSAAGVVGHFIRDLLVGLLGFGAFLLPLTLMGLAVAGMVSRGIRLPVIQLILIFWFILSLLHIFNPLEGADLSAFEYLRAVFQNVEGRVVFGGLVGAVLGSVLSFFLGNIGAIVVLFAATIILLVLVTGRSFVKFVGKGVDAARDYYDERASRIVEDDDYVDDDELEIPTRGARGRNSEIIQINDTTAREVPEILLLHEQAAEKNRKKAAANPLFAKRERKPKKVESRTEILTFPESVAGAEPWINPPRAERAPEPEYDDDYDDYDDYDDEISTAPKGVPEAQILPFVPPARVASEPEYDDFDDFDDEVDDDPEDDLDDPDDDFDDFDKSCEGPIVKGLVDDSARQAQKPLAPMFADGDEGELLEFDEYANANIRSSARAASQGSANVESDEPDPLLYENYELPSYDLLARNERAGMSPESRTQVLENSRILEETLRSFRVEAKVVEVSVGPTVTRYDLAPAPGVKVASIANLSNDLALSLAAQGIRIEAPIPGKSAVGIEIPNKDPQGVFLREILEDDKFEAFPSKLAFAVGKDIAGEPVVTDIARMPHLLIAGATGSGKSVCINTLIASLLYKARPDEVKLLMIDPKVVELSVYNGIPHLLIPVVTDPKKASGALSWAVAEMETRYAKFAETGCRELKGFNRYAVENDLQELPQIVIIIDELADLMMTCKGEVEDSICRLAQKARAAGIHLIVATQRPSVDVITGLIKANIPSRLAFAVSSGTDSRTVLDMYGAEKLLGKGDMLFLPMGQNKPIRVQGGFISDKEVEGLVKFLKAQAPTEFTTEMIQKVTMPGKPLIEGELDEFFRDAVEFLLVKGKASTSMLQRQFRIGYNRASRLMEDLEVRGIVGPEDGVKPRKVTITREEFRELYG